MADSDNDDEPIRCPCGSKKDLPQSEEYKEAWVCCETCKAWQHSICVGLTEDDSAMPEQYFCEECKPEHHKRFEYGSGSDNRYDIAKERQEMHVMLRTREKDKVYQKTMWLVTEIDAIAEGHPQATTVEWAKFNGMRGEFDDATAKVRRPSEMPLAPWSKDGFDDMVRLSIRLVLWHGSVSVLERFRASMIKVRFDEAEAVAMELWSLRARLNDEFMTKMEANSSEQGKANIEAVRKYFNME